MTDVAALAALAALAVLAVLAAHALDLFSLPGMAALVHMHLCANPPSALFSLNRQKAWPTQAEQAVKVAHSRRQRGRGR